MSKFQILRLDKQSGPVSEGVFDTRDEANEAIREFEDRIVEIDGRQAQVFYNWMVIEYEPIKVTPGPSTVHRRRGSKKKRNRPYQGRIWWNE